MTREQIERDREVAVKAWVSAEKAFGSVYSRAELLARYLEAEHPLPAPEPQRVTGPTGETYELRMADGTAHLLTMHGRYGAYICPSDRATVANLLVPFEDVVRATLNELGCGEVRGKAGAGPAFVPGDNPTWPGLTREIANRLPLILKRLEAR